MECQSIPAVPGFWYKDFLNVITFQDKELCSNVAEKSKEIIWIPLQIYMVGFPYNVQKYRNAIKNIPSN